ncbi:protease inhibitor I9 family protein, partial [Gottfriedia acidiceleris]
MKIRKKKMLNILVTSVLTTSFFASYLMPQKRSYATSNSVESMLKGLTDEQRQSIKRLTPQEGFIIDPSLLSLKDKTAHVIVELKTSPLEETQQSKSKASPKEKKQKVRGEQAFFKQRLTELFTEKASKQKSSQTFNQQAFQFDIKQTYENVFNGMAMTIPTNQINTLLQTGVVKRIWKDNEVRLPKNELSTLDQSEGKAIPPALPHIGVDRLHSEGLKGQGIKVGVLDTGIDY